MDIYQCLKFIYSDRLSSFFTKLPKNNMGVLQGCLMPPNARDGALWGASDALMMPPCYFWTIWSFFHQIVKKK